MRKTALVMALLLTASAVSAQLPKIGVGAFGGISLPVAQKDQAQGTEYGIRARVAVLSFLSAEAQLAFTKWGKPDPIDGFPLGIEGSKVTAFGFNGVLGGGAGAGMKPFFVAGAGKYKIKNDQTKEEISRLGYSGGLGLGIGLGPLTLDARGEAVVVPLADGGSKKAVKVTVGFFYSF
ncbi:MAG: outer membrane beta-barrel protein [candidate division Zixibacteria bacterium]|nr:outer membrane beta-barrel protein [candidate division Zixibacteria bacterium]